MLTIDPDHLLNAYRAGLFPMAEDGVEDSYYWIDPEFRGLLPIHTLHVPRRLRKTVRQGVFEVRVDCAFGDVIRACAETSEGRNGTWINKTIINAFIELHRLGHAHSIECWQDGKLVGGLYGLSLGGIFFGESMFSRVRDASKVALVHLAARLWRGGYVLLDTQFINDHLEQFGAYELPRQEFLHLLQPAIKAKADFYCAPVWADVKTMAMRGGDYSEISGVSTTSSVADLPLLPSSGTSSTFSGSSELSLATGFLQSITQTS